MQAIKTEKGLTPGLFYVMQGKTILGLIVREARGKWHATHDHVCARFATKDGALDHFKCLFGTARGC